MAEDLHVGVLAGAEHACGHLLARLVEAGVNAGDDDIELRERVVGKVHRSVEQDVALAAGQDAEGHSRPFRVGLVVPQLLFIARPLRTFVGMELFGQLVGLFANARGVQKRAAVVHAVGHGEELGVVGDGDVFQAAGYGPLGHFADGLGTVGLEGVACGDRHADRHAR